MNQLEQGRGLENQGLLAPHIQRKVRIRRGHPDLRMSKRGRDEGEVGHHEHVLCGKIPFGRESYAIVEDEKVPFTTEEINELYDLPNDLGAYPGQRLIVDCREGDAKKIIKLIVWPEADCTSTPTRRLQLFPHQLTIEANVWLFFIKKKIFPTHHDSTILTEYALVLYCINAKKPFNLGYVMNEAFLSWMRNPKNAKPFPTTVKKLCLKYLDEEPREIPQIDMVGGKCNLDIDTSPPPSLLKRKASTSGVEVNLGQDYQPVKDPPRKKRDEFVAKEAQSDEEAFMQKEGEFRDVLYNVITESMNVTFKEMLLENVATKEQIASLNTQVQGLEATVSNLNSTVSQLSSTLTNLTILMISYLKQLHHITKRHHRKFAAKMEYMHAVFVQRATICHHARVDHAHSPIQLIDLTPSEPDPCPEN
ncbi:hypothetical protein E5676_scaffold94G00870 [Cucumis melo var. makuwa]|uniref:Putative plant transposon protein domain-containing protein n=1 Tax=Cucumis melo var. makuwa TaxID=1194695 RepID=A0A5D3CVL7_CUCMM|nr:hypothetical protein E5676_scaffold94G00870 [Cucumis melo var. makuwa]